MASAPKSKAPASDSIMMPARMKPLLARAKRGPISAAMGRTADGQVLLLLDRRARPKTVLAMLRAAAAKAKLRLNAATLRFGRARIDPEYDAGTVRFFVNKATSATTRRLLVRLLRRANYRKAEINADANLGLEG